MPSVLLPKYLFVQLTYEFHLQEDASGLVAFLHSFSYLLCDSGASP